MSKREEQYMKVWMSQKEIKMIEKYLTPETIMLEYGSGGSTIHFSKFVKEYYSLEHNKEWYNKVKIKISNNDKITTFLSENKKMDEIIDSVMKDVGNIQGFNKCGGSFQYQLIRRMMHKWKQYSIMTEIMKD